MDSVHSMVFLAPRLFIGGKENQYKKQQNKIEIK